MTQFPVFPRKGRDLVPDPSDSRSPVAVAAALASTVTTIVAEMAIPPLIGYWLDEKLGTRVLFVTLGAIGGLILGLNGLIRLARSQEHRGERKP